MDISLTGLVVLVGNYGSGKTEVAVNLALHAHRAGIPVRIADLDLVNPYFRTREARHTLRALGVDLVIPPEMYLQADLPMLTPEVAGLIRNPGSLSVLDVGGDDVGAKVLSSLTDALSGRSRRMLQVVNPFRPFTETIEGCLLMKERIETASRLSMDGIIGNANLMDETRAEHIVEGHRFLRRLSRESGLPLEFVTAPAELAALPAVSGLDCPILPIYRQLVPPWKRAADVT